MKTHYLDYCSADVLGASPTAGWLDTLSCVYRAYEWPTIEYTCRALWLMKMSCYYLVGRYLIPIEQWTSLIFFYGLSLYGAAADDDLAGILWRRLMVRKVRR